MQAAVTMIFEAPPILPAMSSHVRPLSLLAVRIFSVTSARFIGSPLCSMRVAQRHDLSRRIDRCKSRLHQPRLARIVAATFDFLIERLGTVDQELHQMVA